VYGKVIALPPVEAVNHPLNVKPVRVGVPGLVAIDPPVVVVPLAIALPL
jgi:hypothetical protein